MNFQNYKLASKVEFEYQKEDKKMQLSKEAIEEFKQSWRDEYQSEINDEEANRIGVSLLQLVKLIIKPKINEIQK